MIILLDMRHTQKNTFGFSTIFKNVKGTESKKFHNCWYGLIHFPVGDTEKYVERENYQQVLSISIQLSFCHIRSLG